MNWDITYLPLTIKGFFVYDYVFLDIWSRKIVGWEIHNRETPELASQCFERIVARHGARPQYLHSDNGNPNLHSGIGYVTPEQRHYGIDKELFTKRNRTLKYARLFRPEIRSSLKDWVHCERVVLNAQHD